MVGSLLPGEEVGAVLRLTLSGAVVALVANGLGPVPLARTVSGTFEMDRYEPRLRGRFIEGGKLIRPRERPARARRTQTY